MKIAAWASALFPLAIMQMPLGFPAKLLLQLLCVLSASFVGSWSGVTAALLAGVGSYQLFLSENYNHLTSIYLVMLFLACCCCINWMAASARLAKEALKDSEMINARAQAILETAVDSVITIDQTGRIKSVNAATERMFGYKVDELINRNINMLMPAPYSLEHDQYLQNYINSGIAKVIGTGREVVGKRKDSTVFPLDLSVSEVKFADSRLFTGIVRDVSERKLAEQRLKSAQEKLQRVLDNIFSFVGLISTDGILLEANRAPLDAANLKREDVIGKPFADTYWWNYSPQIQIKLQDALKKATQGESIRFDVPVRIAENKLIEIDVCFSPLLDDNGNVVGIVGSAVDVSERVSAEKKLRQSEERYRLVLEATTDGFWEWNVIDDQCFWSERLYVLLGLDVSTNITMDFLYKRIHPEDLPTIKTLVSTFFTATGPQSAEYRLRHENNNYVWVRSTGKAVRSKSGEVIRIIGAVQDIGERKRADAEIQQHRVRLQKLAAQMQLIEERERRHFAQALHDSIGQSLALCAIKLSAPEIDKRHIREIKVLIGQIIEETRTLTFEMSPPILYELGLHSALEWYVDKLQTQFGIKCAVCAEGRPYEVNESLKVVLFQSVRELLVNVVKHASASEALVSILYSKSSIRICVKDNGVGFGDYHVRPSRGFGLFNIRERLQDLGGTIEIDSRCKFGGCVNIFVPVFSGETHDSKSATG